jgi:hypothetical protein
LVEVTEKLVSNGLIQGSIWTPISSPSSDNDKSTIGNPLEGSLYSYIGDGGTWDEPSDVEADGGEDKGGEEGGIDASFEEEDKALTYYHERLIPRLTSHGDWA